MAVSSGHGPRTRGDGDGWAWCDLGHKHWGRHGAAGLLVRERSPTGDRVVLQHRAEWSHHGGTWGLPGGARDSHESAVSAALREAAEEAGLSPASIRPLGLVADDHGGWSYTTVVAEPTGRLDPRPTGGESIEVRWIPVDEVDRLPLHPGFAHTWPRLRGTRTGMVLVVDGANVVGTRGRGDGWWRDRAGAARRLRDDLVRLAAAGIAAADLPPGVPPDGLDVLLPRIILVVEGAARTVATEPVPDANALGSADERTGGERSASDARWPRGSDPGRAEKPSNRRLPDPDPGWPPGADPRRAAGSPADSPAAAGHSTPAARPAPRSAARVEIAAARGSGDDTIVDVAGSAIGTARVLVVTADRELAARVTSVGATVRPSWLLRLIDGLDAGQTLL